MADTERCVFCDIVSGTVPSHTIYEDERTVAFLDINPWTKGQTLVIPKRHVQWWHELPDDENSSLFHTAKIVADKIMKAFSPDFVFIYARGRRIPHAHIFLIPTYKGDILERVFGALELIQETPQELANLKEDASLLEAAELLRFK